MLEIQGIHVSIQSVAVLRGLSLNVPRRSMVGLVGRNARRRAASASTATTCAPWRRTNAPAWASATCRKTAAWCRS
jgi:ABC-type branched-subunit amino acid transport system ATPase component